MPFTVQYLLFRGADVESTYFFGGRVADGESTYFFGGADGCLLCALPPGGTGAVAGLVFVTAAEAGLEHIAPIVVCRSQTCWVENTVNGNVLSYADVGAATLIGNVIYLDVLDVLLGILW